MKNLKQILISLLALLLCLCTVAGCTPTETPDDTDTDTDTETDTDDGAVAPPWEGKYEIITVAEALELCGEAGNLTTERYYLQGTVVSIDNPSYGQMTIEDETGSISVYGTYSADGSIGYAEMEEKPYKGDLVLLHCTLQNYNGTKEVKNARLIDFMTVKVEVNEADYTDMTVAEAREAAEGTKIKVDGVVARITYANGMKPSGVMLVDGTQSIYVYDADIAGRAKIGNTVTVLGSKTYWVLDSEQANADKFGYKGCCQLEDVTLVDIDTSVTDFDTSWIPTGTVKALIETPVTENITASIVKVNALVKKQEGTGFTNYYFYDLDGTTGAYAYTQCNGSDFAWLDEFDGKICTVYLSALNAKSTSSACFFRLLPVAVKDEGFTFDLNDTAKHVVEYYGLPQFKTSYTGNPAAEMITAVFSSLLGFENATLTYTSSNTAVVFFTEESGKVIFNCGAAGKATVTVKGSHNGKTFEGTVEITVGANASVDSITVQAAKDTAVGETVTVRGIVGPSVVNKDAFYLFDETGMIAVVLKNASSFSEIEIGQEIVVTAKRDCYKNEGTTHAGQTCLTGAEVVANYYGKHAYPETGFITDKTLADIYNLNVNEDHSTEVYVVKATVKVIEAAYYTQIKVAGNGIELTLYCSSANQYSFLKAFKDQEVTLEIAPCNWNNKNFYAGCVLAVRTPDGKVLNELNFNK